VSVDKRSNLPVPFEKSSHVSHVSANVSPVKPSQGSNKGSSVSVDKRVNTGSSVSEDKRLNAGSSVSASKRSNHPAPTEKSSHVSASPSTMLNGSKNRIMPSTLQSQRERESQKSGLHPNRPIINRSGSSIATFDQEQHITTQKRTYIQAGSQICKKAGASVQKHNADGGIYIDRSGSSTATFQRDQRIATKKRIYMQAGEKAGQQEGCISSDGRPYIDRSGSSMATCPGSLGLPGGGGAKKWKGMAAFMEVKQAESSTRDNEIVQTKSRFTPSNEKENFSRQSNMQGENRGSPETFGKWMNRGVTVSAQKDQFTMSQGGDLLDHGRMIIDRSGSSIATCPGSLGLPGPDRTKGKGMANFMNYE